MSDPFLAEIVMFAGNFAPRGWALCDGQLLAISQYSAVFSLLGTTYGGDGRTTFALPDMRGRVAIHPGNGPGLSDYRQGPGGGAESVTLTTNNLPAHSHSIATGGAGTQASPSGAYLGDYGSSAPPSGPYSTSASGGTMAAGAVSNTGGGQSFKVIQPWCGVQFIIALQGTFPSRS